MGPSKSPRVQTQFTIWPCHWLGPHRSWWAHHGPVAAMGRVMHNTTHPEQCTNTSPQRSIEMNDDALSKFQFKGAAKKEGEEIELQRIMLLTVRTTPIFCPNKTHSKPPNRICRASLAVERKPKNPVWKFNLPFKRWAQFLSTPFNFFQLGPPNPFPIWVFSFFNGLNWIYGSFCMLQIAWMKMTAVGFL